LYNVFGIARFDYLYLVEVKIWQLTRENIMNDKQTVAPDSTAVRVALWRAMHVDMDELT